VEEDSLDADPVGLARFRAGGESLSDGFFAVERGRRRDEGRFLRRLLVLEREDMRIGHCCATMWVERN